MTVTQNDTAIDGLVINRLNQTQFDNASALDSEQLYCVDPQFTGGKVLVSTSDGDIEESTINTANVITDVTVDGTSVVTSRVASITLPVTDVQQDGVSIVTSGVANIPDAVVFRDWD